MQNQLKGLTNTELIQLFEAVRDELNLKTITEYSKAHNMVYNTAKTKQPFTTVCKTKYIPDNGRH